MKALKTILPFVLAALAVYLVVYQLVWRWGFTRHWVAPGRSLQVQDMTSGGVRRDMLGPGRQFLPYFTTTAREVGDFTVPPGQMACVLNHVGAAPPEGQFIVGEDQQGTLRRVLTAGTYRINPYYQEPFAYLQKGRQPLKTQPLFYVPPGFVGLRTPQGGGERGERPRVLQAGYHDLNPVEYEVFEKFGVGYDTLDFHTDLEMVEIRDKEGRPHQVPKPKPNTGIAFPLADGTLMHLDITVVCGVLPADAPYVFAELGDMDQVYEKFLKPQITSICKNAGSDFTTQQFIVGKSREEFQQKFTHAVQEVARGKRIKVLIALVRGYHPDPVILATIQSRMMAEQERYTLADEQKRDKVAAELAQAKQMVEVALKDFDAQTLALVEVERENGRKKAAEIEAEGDRQAAEIDRRAAEMEAQARLIEGKAAAEVIELDRKADASLIDLSVKAYGSASAYSLAKFAEGLDPGLRVVFRYAGPGTFWTDNPDMQDLAARKMLGAAAQTQPAEPRR